MKNRAIAKDWMTFSKMFEINLYHVAFQGTYRVWFSDLDEQHEIPRSRALESFTHHQSPKRPPQTKTCVITL